MGLERDYYSFYIILLAEEEEKRESEHAHKRLSRADRCRLGKTRLENIKKKKLSRRKIKRLIVFLCVYRVVKPESGFCIWDVVV